MTNLIKTLLAAAALMTAGLTNCATAQDSDDPAPPSAGTTVVTSSSANWVCYQNVSYGSNPAQIMDIYVPSTGKIHSTIILIHGGGWVGGTKMNLLNIAQMLATDGFTVANINYRLATPTAYHYPAAVQDAKASIAFIEKNAKEYKVDTTRIAAFGTSAGANLAIDLGLSNSVKAVVDFYGPVNFTDTIFLNDDYNGEPNSDLVTTYLGATLAANPTLYKNASPLYTVTSKMPPTIIFHGGIDDVVPDTQSIEFSQKLLQLHVVSELNIEATCGHGFLTNSSTPATYVNQATKFLRNNMN